MKPTEALLLCGSPTRGLDLGAGDPGRSELVGGRAHEFPPARNDRGGGEGGSVTSFSTNAVGCSSQCRGRPLATGGAVRGSSGQLCFG